MAAWPISRIGTQPGIRNYEWQRFLLFVRGELRWKRPLIFTRIGHLIGHLLFMKISGFHPGTTPLALSWFAWGRGITRCTRGIMTGLSGSWSRRVRMTTARPTHLHFAHRI